MFANLKRVNDDYATNTHFGVRQLSLIESVVLAVVSEDFALGAPCAATGWTRRNILIRRRIHEDVAEGEQNRNAAK